MAVRNYNLKEMLEYKRPDGSKHQTKFCNHYLKPVMSGPDLFGNYTRIIGDQPRVAFMAHHDTVHRETGKQVVANVGGFYKAQAPSNCLGADCTTGVYIILKMIEAGIPGVYVVHGAEEIGCIGSAGMVASRPDWLDHVDAAISFDRKGYTDIITHQLGERTCSDAFAESLADILDMDYKPDDGGVYTDSNEYRGIIPECTNISVGYFCQHTQSETQDINFLNMLVDQILKADWNRLVIERDPNVVEVKQWATRNYYTGGNNGFTDYVNEYFKDNVVKFDEGKKVQDSKSKDLEEMTDIVRQNSHEIARLLREIGYDAYDLIDEVYNYKRHPDYDDEIAF